MKFSNSATNDISHINNSLDVDIANSSHSEILNVPEAAKLLHVSEYSLRNKAKNGEIPAAKIGKKWIFVKQDLVNHVRSLYNVKLQAAEVPKFSGDKKWESTHEKTRNISGFDSQPLTVDEFKKALDY